MGNASRPARETELALPGSPSRDEESQRLAAVRRVVLDQAVPVYRFLYAITGDVPTAEDLTQDTIFRAWQAATTLKDAARVRGWVYAIAANAARSHVRRKRRFSWIPLEMLGEIADPRPTQGECSGVVECLARLRLSDREVIMLVAHAGFSVPQAAEVLGLSTAAAEKRWQRGRDRLRCLLEGERS